ncbi:hypothetical protein WMY93_013300 [Mugilogobius chulae]|uniref:Polymerase (RNA) II (DNA directed) polypeptide M n=1 Tax=Mugilogobius chulae TaxID=88201 RepID=A0AAW0PB21_9GOBI
MEMSWTERQGQVGDLIKHSKEDLQELLQRQEKILSNKRLLRTLPDKGDKIQEFAVKIRQALKHHEEAERKQRLVSEARMEFQAKYQQAFSMQQRTAQKTHSAGDSTQPSSLSGTSAEMTKDSLIVELAPEAGLVEAMERVTLSTVQVETTSKQVVEQWKIILLPGKDDISPSGSSSPSHSSGMSSPLSTQARKERDRKHLDDITAAKLPPLHHSPAQLLSLEESATLLKEQTKKQQELQAKLGAQKLSEGLKFSMGSYTPDSGPMAAYREVHDEAAQLSSEED